MFHGAKRSGLFAFTQGGNAFPFSAVEREYRKMLRRIASGDISRDRCDIVAAVRAERHVYRGGSQTKAAEAAEAESNASIAQLLEELRQELAAPSPRARQTSKKGKKRRPPKADPHGYKGRQVSMPATYWHLPEEHSAFTGVVGKFAKWKYKGKTQEGYEIKFEDCTEKLPMADFVPHLMPIAEPV